MKMKILQKLIKFKVIDYQKLPELFQISIKEKMNCTRKENLKKSPLFVNFGHNLKFLSLKSKN